jgi:hypothetical protein
MRMAISSLTTSTSKISPSRVMMSLSKVILCDFGVLIMVENPYKRRLRRRMIQDPVTGKANDINPRKSKKTKISRPESGIDLRLLDNFDSKLIAKKRLSVCPLRSLS